MAADGVTFGIGDGLRPGSTRRARALWRQVADANESVRTATKQFGELEVQANSPSARGPKASKT